MATRSHSPVRAVGPVLVGCALLLTSWLLLTHVGFWKHGQRVDTGIYQGYALNTLDGQVPYRDFPVEYPPAALPALILPELGRPSPATYRFRFEWLMALCAVVLLVSVDSVLRALHDSEKARYGVQALLGVSPLILGPVVLTRFDFWPAALSVAALAAYLRDRSRLGGAILGLAAAAKLYPAIILPIAIAYVWQRQGRAAALRSLAMFAAVFLVCFLPFAIVAPHGVLHPFTVEVHRPLELESLGAALLVAAHHVFGLSLGVAFNYGSSNLGGVRSEVTAALTTSVELVALVWIWVTSARRRLSGADLVTASGAAAAILVAFGKVFSPQYLIWLISLVALVHLRVRKTALVLLIAACALTQTWYPRDADAVLVYLRQPETWFVLARDLVVVALAVVLTRAFVAPQSDR